MLKRIPVIKLTVLAYVSLSCIYIMYNEVTPEPALIFWTIFYYNINKLMLILGLAFNFIPNKTFSDLNTIRFLLIQSLCFVFWLDVGTWLMGYKWMCEHRNDSYVFLVGGLLALIVQWVVQRRNAL